jgi:L-seryl-tRNA(Ser) seleniumtransferase
MANGLFKNIPSVTDLLDNPHLRNLVDKVSHHVVVTEVRLFLDNLRNEIRTKAGDFQVPSTAELAERIARFIVHQERPRQVAVINATGILLHTGLGRAPMARQAAVAMAEAAENYVSLEIDPESGERGERLSSVERLLRELTRAEAAAVVNNNAGATLLTLAALAAHREVVVSRGQLIEIGGSYRLPDVMSASGAVLREVGTTNKTRIGDYERVCGEQTAALMRVHTSNYRIVGFAEETPLSELVTLARKRNLIVIDDIGSGALIDFAGYGLKHEPVASASLAAGADLVLFSGDKLLGGPQCGVILGRQALVAQILKHPLMRALRVDKTTLAALAATLLLYRDRKQAEQHVPLLSLLSTSADNLKSRAERLAPQIAACRGVARAEAMEARAQLGGGSLPDQSIPTWCVAVTPAHDTVDTLARKLRLGTPPVFGRIQNERLLLDLRSVFPAQDMQLVQALDAATPRSDAAQP